MSYFDDVYCKLCKEILENGIQVHNRTGIDTIKVPSAHFHLDLSKEFPILTTKQLFIRQAVTEMLWIYQAQSNDVRWFKIEMFIFGINGKSMKMVTGLMKIRVRC